ncbi:MAG: hypothetical protein ACR2HD_10915 [Solirubrobacteraceae bacterium]|nr:MAG: hypothetical protein DLM63_11560 [Solirubrobacterales bacterium]
MTARRAYRVLVRAGGGAPAFLAARDRVDHVEVVDLQSGEVELFWDLPARESRRLARRLREDLDLLEAEQFIEAWRRAG